ncbi:efflux RND transporter periplasmic adaptor subunit [Coralloluteibacterium stylophorae]|uniref:Efflux RND transporter periplasmic adaptor subunit n=1 Tax=Coralloluteibacterium stylophorae TaxID=1776034 RepID=A0A8J8AYI3_9GAMM|nr:efflux RND transporter periplasmic adaptor subunit [Coralloluteibacterium stylophorae]MBS7455544.1 efflux RND transporter periplasmic adaptor subunit [Coralloluteibacterium stylophorae]
MQRSHSLPRHHARAWRFRAAHGRCGGSVALCLALLACGGEPPPPQGPRPVVVEHPQTARSQRQTLDYSGRVEAAEGTQLSFQVSGRVETIHVRDGEDVERGELLAELDDTDYRVRLREAMVNERTAAADFARRSQLEEEGILSPAALEQSQAQLASARAAREQAERQVAYTRLEAPYDGRVARSEVEEGVVVQAGQPIFTMQDSGIVEIAVDVPETDAARLDFDAGLAATGRVLAAEGQPAMELRYHEHATVPEQQSRTYRLVLRGVPPEGVNLLPGMAVRVSIPDPNPPELGPGRARVPLAAVLTDEGGRSVVWTVAADGSAHPVAVELVQVDEGAALVGGDLDADARVVVAGARMLHEGQQVEPRMRD